MMTEQVRFNPLLMKEGGKVIDLPTTLALQVNVYTLLTHVQLGESLQ